MSDLLNRTDQDGIDFPVQNHPVDLDSPDETDPEEQPILADEEPEFASPEEDDPAEQGNKPSLPDIDSILEEKLKALQAQQAQGELSRNLKELVETLKPKEPSKEPPKPLTARLSPEEKKKLNEELYTTDNPADLIEQTLIQKIEGLVGALAGETARKLVEHEAEILRASNEEFREFEPEIQQIIQSLPESQRYTPGIYKWALEQAKAKNIDKLVEKKLQEKLAELGVMQNNSGSNPSGSTQAPRPIPPRQAPSQASTGGSPLKPKVYVDRATWDAEVERAIALGIGPGSSFWPETRARLIEKYSRPSKGKVQLR